MKHIWIHEDDFKTLPQEPLRIGLSLSLSQLAGVPVSFFSKDAPKELLAIATLWDNRTLYFYRNGPILERGKYE